MRNEKHIPYFEIEEALGKEGCAVCRLTEERVKKHIETVVCEHLTDKFFRVAFNKDFGFCNKHAYMVLKSANTMSITIAHETIIDEVITSIKKNSLKTSDRCSICDFERGREKQSLSTIKAVLKDEAFKKAFLASSGLCLPHFIALKKSVFRLPSWLVDFEEEYFKNLHKSSLAYMRKTASDEEKNNLAKIIPMLYGYNGLSKG